MDVATLADPVAVAVIVDVLRDIRVRLAPPIMLLD